MHLHIITTSFHLYLLSLGNMYVKIGGRQYNWGRMFLFLQFFAVFLFGVFEYIFL